MLPRMKGRFKPGIPYRPKKLWWPKVVQHIECINDCWIQAVGIGAYMKISDIDNVSLDRWVAKAEGIEVRYSNTGGFWRVLGEIDEVQWLPHRDWAQAGPIIEREKIAVFPYGEQWAAIMGSSNRVDFFEHAQQHPECIGSTPLIAAMRCYIVHRFNVDQLENE